MQFCHDGGYKGAYYRQDYGQQNRARKTPSGQSGCRRTHGENASGWTAGRSDGQGRRQAAAGPLARYLWRGGCGAGGSYPARRAAGHRPGHRARGRSTAQGGGHSGQGGTHARGGTRPAGAMPGIPPGAMPIRRPCTTAQLQQPAAKGLYRARPPHTGK